MQFFKGVLFALVAMTLLPTVGYSKAGSMNGFIVDAYTGEAIPHAYVVVGDGMMGVAADGKGYFEIDRLPAGEISVEVNRIGYRGATQTVRVEAGEQKHLKVRLDAEAVRFRKTVITATRDPMQQSDVTVATDVLSRDEIERTGSQSVGELLRGETGLFVKNYGDIGSLKTVSIRGASDNQMLVLLDGQRLNLAQGTTSDLSDLPLNSIERVEIIRGGHSALYGSDAVGGVVNLITRTPSDDQELSSRIHSTIGSFGTRIVDADIRQKVGEFGYFFTQNYTESEGEFEFEDDEGRSVERSNNRLKRNDTFLKLRYTPNPGSILSGFVQYHDADRGVPGPLSFPSETAIQKDRSWKYSLGYESRIRPEFHLRAQSYLFQFKQNYDDPGGYFPIHSEHDNDGYGGSVQSDLRIFPGNDITGGYEFRRDRIESTDVSSQRRSTHSLFVQDKIRLPLRISDTISRVSIIPALRIDNYTDVTTQYSPKIGFSLNYVTDVQVIVRGNWGRSYRVPSFNELYWPAGPFTAGNPDLEPEKGQGFDLGFVLNLERSGFWGFEVNHFNTNLDNLILWEPGDDWVWRPQNVQKADLKGFETRFTFQDTGGLLSVGAAYDYLDAVNESTDDTVRGKQLIYRPKHKASVDLQFHFDRLTTGGTYRFVGHRFTSADNAGSLEGYHTFDAGVTWMQPVSGSTLKIRTEVRNILDREIEVIDDYPAPGREIRTTVGFEF